MACVYIQHSARCAAFEQNNETALQRRPKVTGNADRISELSPLQGCESWARGHRAGSPGYLLGKIPKQFFPMASLGGSKSEGEGALSSGLLG